MTYIVGIILITEFNFRNRNCVYFFAVSIGFKLDKKYICIKYIKLILNQKIIINNI